jgi:branched-chain amino acid transport system substrate-binding protein
MNKTFHSRWIAGFLPLLVIAGLVLVLTGCLSASALEPTDTVAPIQPAPGSEETFRLGVLGPFTGPSESTGREFRGAATMALDAIDWQIGEYRIEPVWIDSQSDPDKAVQAYERAVVEGDIQAGILNWHSSVAVACMEVSARYQIPHIFPYGATETVNEIFHSDPEKYGYWMNKGWPTPAKLSISYVQAVEDAIARGAWVPGGKTVAICAENTHWGRSFGEAIRGQLEAAGWTTVATEYFNLDEVQFYSLINEFKAKNVALVAATTTSLPSFAAFINQADEVGLESLIIADGLGWGGEWYEMTGASSNYVIDQIPGWATAEGWDFAIAFEERWGVPPSPSAAGLAYDGTNMFIQVAEHALTEYGELSSETIYRWASENLQTGAWSYTGGIVMEAYRYTPQTLPDPVVGAGYYMFPVRQYFDGEGKIVYPPEWAEQELQPKPH